jgi:cytochrome P450
VSVQHEITEFPVQRSCPHAPPTVYQELRATAPATRVRLPGGVLAWAVTGHEDVRALLTDPRFSSDRRDPGFPGFIEGQAQLARMQNFSLISMDAPEHGQARRAVISEFTVRRARTMRPRIQQIVEDLLDELLAGDKPADLVARFALPIPSLVICELLGVPYADHEFFQKHGAALLNRTTTMDQRITARTELKAYLLELITAKEREPADDLLSRQIERARAEGAELDRDDLASLAFLLLVAGHETTANMISLGTLTLLENPAAFAALRDDPERTPAAVEELLRLFTIAEFATSRVATEDLDFAGVRVRAGEGVLGLSHAANHDPAVFAKPDELDIDRGARNHVAFGFGPHQCLGQNLARAELQIVFDTLGRRVPTLALAVDAAELPFKDDANIYGLYELPVTW